MAVVHTKTAALTLLDTVPSEKPRVEDKAGRLKIMPFTIEVTDNDDVGSTIRIARVHSQNRVISCLLFRDALTAMVVDVGLYQTNANGGAVVDADAYASAVSIAAADKLGLEVLFEARDIASIMNYVYQDAGLTTDSNLDYDLTLTITTQVTDPGTISGYLIFEDRT